MAGSSMAAVAGAVTLVMACCLLGATHGQSHYFTINRGTGVRSRVSSESGMLDTLQRGHEGLLVQLNTLNDAIKEDELKLNNVFYKLGRHDTDILANTAVQSALKTSARKLEAKLNKQTFNLDFLRRHVLELKRRAAGNLGTATSVATLQNTVTTLQQSLAQTLYRTEQLENKTKHLEQQQRLPTHYSPGLDDNNIYFASRSPKTTYYYLDENAIAGVCDESSGWESSPEGGCWLLSDGEEVASFPVAVAKCASKGGALAQLVPSDHRWPQKLTDNIKGNKKQSYWSSGTCAFTPGVWTFLFSGDAIAAEHWTNGRYPPVPAATTTDSNHCAAMTPSGLLAMSCTLQLPYVCEKL